MRRASWLNAADLTNRAFDASNRLEFRRWFMEHLAECAGGDYAVFAAPSAPPSPSELWNIDYHEADASRRTMLKSASRLQRAFGQLQRFGAIVDTELYSHPEWSRLPYVAYHQLSHGVTSNLILSWADRSGEMTVVNLARTSGRFTIDDQVDARRIVKALAVADASLIADPFSPSPAACAGLTERQREIVEYVCKGYSNAEISRACGISLFTARNHLAKLFEVYRVSTRTELAMLVRASDGRGTPSG